MSSKGTKKERTVPLYFTSFARSSCTDLDTPLSSLLSKVQSFCLPSKMRGERACAFLRTHSHLV